MVVLINMVESRPAGSHADQLFRDGKISAEDADRLNLAFSFTLQRLSLVDRNDPVCEIVARKVIEIDAAGTRDPEEIAKRLSSSSVSREIRTELYAATGGGA